MIVGGEVRRSNGRLRTALAVAAVVLTAFACEKPSTTLVPAVGSKPAAPASCSSTTYTVVAGDHWTKIAGKVKVTVAALLSANKASASTIIHPGQKVCVPTTAAAAPATTTTTTVAPATPVPSGSTVPPSSFRIAQFPVQGPCTFINTFGAARGGGRAHEGVDIMAKQGQYVYAALDGVLGKQYVDRAGSLSGNGWQLNTDDGSYLFYAHLSGFAPGLSTGTRVVAGQVIGYVGKTGNAGVNHLHFEVHPGKGAAVDPTSIVKAVDGCKVTTPPAQPGGAAPAAPSVAAAVATAPTAPTTTTPAPAQPPPPIAAAGGSGWQIGAPQLALDTAGARLTPGAPRAIRVDGLAGVGSSRGVLVDVVARNVAGRGYLTVHPCGLPTGSSTLNLTPGRANAAGTAVGVIDGTICITSSVATDVRVDVVGAMGGGSEGLRPIPAVRAVDTRGGQPLATSGALGLSPSTLGVPAGTRAVTATFTVVDPPTGGSLGIGACGAGSPWIVPFGAGATQAFSGIVRIGDGGLCLSTTSAAHVIVDVTGAWATGGSVAPAGPMRVLDTRSGPPITGQRTATLGGMAGVGTAQLTIGIIGGAGPSALFAWPCSQPKPAASVGYTPAGTVTAVSVSMALSGGALCLAATAPVHAVVDVVAVG